MVFTENQIINNLKKIVDIFCYKYNGKNLIPLDYIVLVNTSYNNDNIAHFCGFIAKTKKLLLCCIEVDLGRISSFSSNLVNFLLAHELCHSLDMQLDGDAEFLACGFVQVSQSLGLNKVISAKSSPTTEDIKNRLCQLKPDIYGLTRGEHKCVDLWAKTLLNLSDNDTKQCMVALYNYSTKNKDISKRLKAVKNQDYKSCLEKI